MVAAISAASARPKNASSRGNRAPARSGRAMVETGGDGAREQRDAEQIERDECDFRGARIGAAGINVGMLAGVQGDVISR